MRSLPTASAVAIAEHLDDDGPLGERPGGPPRGGVLGRPAVDHDTPAGGGAGMVLRADILARAFDSLPEVEGRPRLLMSPRGMPLRQARVKELAAGPGPIVVCGRFEGVDQRVIDEFMGHQTEAMRKRYRHLFPSSRRAAITCFSLQGGTAAQA